MMAGGDAPLAHDYYVKRRPVKKNCSNMQNGVSPRFQYFLKKLHEWVRIYIHEISKRFFCFYILLKNGFGVPRNATFISAQANARRGGASLRGSLVA
jgi:hypothetical protein